MEKDPAYPPQDAGAPPGYPGPPAQQQPGYPPQQQQPAGYPPQQQQGYPPQQQPGYPPQQQQPYPPGQGAPATVTVVQQPTTTTIISTSVLGDHPCNIQCPNCHNQVTSSVSREMGGLVWLIAGIMCIVGLWPCCLIPFCITDLYDAKHTCPVCQFHLGFHRKI